MSGLPQKQPDEAGAVSAEDVRALRHTILDDAMDLILTHERLMDNILASSMSGMLTNVICDRIARSIRERVMNVLAEDALAPVSLETTSEFVAGGIIRLSRYGGNRATILSVDLRWPTWSMRCSSGP